MDLTFVFPCLNEQRTLAACVQAVRASLSQDPALQWEIVVADNGSTDDSRAIATAEGARVVPVAERGYGAALRGGIAAAQGRYVMFADCDSTYLYEHALPLYQKAIEHDADMAIASRMIGQIEPGAMPPLHRWLGTPVLTTLINRLFHGHLTDCNSGFRCLRKSAYDTWDIRSNGMEFASELLIKALKAQARTVEIPSGLRPGPPDRIAHLRTWRDGMRHLLFILSEKPAFFEIPGFLLLLLATGVQYTASILGPTNVLGFNIFDFHSQALLLLAGLLGAQVYLLGATLHLSSKEKRLSLTNKLLNIDEGSLFFLLCCGLILAAVLAGGLALVWASHGFAGLTLTRPVMAAVHTLGIISTLILGLTGVHLVKKSAQTR